LVADQVLEHLVMAPARVEQRKAWVRTASRRLAIDEHRARERRGGPTYGLGVFAEGGDMRGPDWVQSPSAEVRRRLLVEKLLEDLSTRDGNLLRDWADGWTAAELAERYDLTPASVNVILTRIRGRLRVGLDRDDADL
jgi:DNA-directed RNA polymerase specialized sigma24 family protein